MKYTLIAVIFVSSFVILTGIGFAQSPQDELTRMVSQLQKAPTDNALREKIIKLAVEMMPAPVVSDTAIEFEGRAQFAFKKAQSEVEFLNAAAEYEKAVAAAPWVLGYYSDLCTIYEKANKFEDAKRNCEFYMIGVTDPAQMTETKRRIAGLKYGIEQRAAKIAENDRIANSPGGRASAMLAILRKQYAGPVKRLLICGVKLNQYWKCTDKEASGSNWVDSVNMNAQPPPKTGPVQYKIVGSEGDMIEIKFGDYGWGGDAFRMGCAKPNGTDPNSMAWVKCPGWEGAGGSLDVVVLFTTASSGSPMIEYRDSCSGNSCRRAQFILQP